MSCCSYNSCQSQSRPSFCLLRHLRDQPRHWLLLSRRVVRPLRRALRRSASLSASRAPHFALDVSHLRRVRHSLRRTLRHCAVLIVNLE